MFSVCILFVRKNGFVYVTLKWFIENIRRKVKERFVTLKKNDVEATIGRKREKNSGPHYEQSCGPTCEQYAGHL